MAMAAPNRQGATPAAPAAQGGQAKGKVTRDAVFVDNTKIQRGPGGFEGMLGREMATRPSDRAKLAPRATSQEYTVGFEGGGGAEGTATLRRPAG